MKDNSVEQYNFFFAERTEPLHTMLVNCGHQTVKSPANYCWHGLRRGSSPLAIWQYTVAGKGELMLNGEVTPLTPGKAFLLTIPENHCYRLPENSAMWEFYFVSIQGSEAIRLWENCRQQHGSVIDFSPESRPMNVIKKILRLCREQPLNDRHQSSALGYEFIMSIFSELNDAPLQYSGSNFMTSVRQYILENLHRQFSVDELAVRFNCSRSHFSKRFKKECGVPPHEFILELKMRWAVRLLQNTGKSIKEIAVECGFEDSSYFAKSFRLFYGRSPREYRDGSRDGQI